MNGQKRNIKHASRCYTASEHGSESGKPCHISGCHAEKVRFGLGAEKGGKGAETSQIVSDFPGSHSLRIPLHEDNGDRLQAARSDSMAAYHFVVFLPSLAVCHPLPNCATCLSTYNPAVGVVASGSALRFLTFVIHAGTAHSISMGT